MFEGDEDQTTLAPAQRTLEFFRARVNNFHEVFTSLFHARRLRSLIGTDTQGFPYEYDELLRYIRRCVSGVDHRFQRPEFPVYLNEVIPPDDFTRRIAPSIDHTLLPTLPITLFPN